MSPHRVLSLQGEVVGLNEVGEMQVEALLVSYLQRFTVASLRFAEHSKTNLSLWEQAGLAEEYGSERGQAG